MNNENRVRRRRRVRSEVKIDNSPKRFDRSLSLDNTTSDNNTTSKLDFLLTRDQITSPPLINTIDQISTELGEDRRNDLDSEYWDDTHDWGSEYNSDYWHFLGQYE